ncbi:uncharacterized protein ALTATR162_LOCUS10902 [Alternaria atra]|uniref:DUF6314 domain-containing protein n=1 Tax=Alternaria atra TaxID=119953 RepID=A0A8J2NAP6_9PLEO|nr:uncharacterized protein ALTATR162_LOCUS7849 [Alternaria atra]XP_043174477.1 uncharacterized protein ALTATR162_LOCUS10902 [Alternaria atra]CAG5174732.1 unnamed protein product [Alternaria atra]CAG5184085.1 unnamed protein product [Alternaria atra]
MFPRAWQVGRYLETYAKIFGITENLLLGKRVINASLQEDNTWKVISDDGAGQLDTRTFDRLIVASGFFNKPASTFDFTPSKNLSTIQHSSNFRSLSELTSSPGKVVVIGGGISGSEAAAQAAFQISNAKHSPSQTTSAHAHSRVFHIINRPFYCLPRYLPQDPQSQDGNFKPAPKFLPLDLMLYNLSRRGDGEIAAAITTVPPEKAQKGHEFLRASIGCGQSGEGYPELAYTASQTQHPGYTGITDTYMEFVRSGIIVPVRGWVKDVAQADDRSFLDVSLQQYEPWYHGPGKEAISQSKVHNVVGIIEATGYKADLDWLDSRVRALLAEDNTTPNLRIPYLLSRGSVLSRRVPTIGFVGFYEGPYWGVMEMQARLLAQSWAKPEAEQSQSRVPDLYKYDDTKRMQEAMNQRSLQVPQFWMADYVGLMEEFARETGVSRDDSLFGGQMGPAFPSRYQHAATSSQAKEVVEDVAKILQASQEDARFIAAAVFIGMQGVWNMTRKIDSRTDTPGGLFVGTAHFHPRQSTDPTTYLSEYLYVEQGIFTMDTGLSFPATRRYVYRYNEARDEITAWFVEDDNKSVGALFNTWGFYAPDDDKSGWRAKGYHWCDPDTYRNHCEFKFRGAKIDQFMIRYEVEGPKKDYSHESWYKRPEADTSASKGD